MIAQLYNNYTQAPTAAVEPASAQVVECLVGLFKWIARRLGNDANLRRQPQKVNTVLSGQVGYRNELAFLP